MHRMVKRQIRHRPVKLKGYAETRFGTQPRPNILILGNTPTRSNNESECFFKVKYVKRIMDNKFCVSE